MAVRGPNNPASGTTNNAVGTVDWTDPGNITSQNDQYATVSSSSATSYLLVGSDYGFSIPLMATLDGIVVEIDRSKQSGTDVVDSRVVLWLNGAAVAGDNKASASSWPTSDAIASYGGSTDIWGTTLTAADVSQSTFGAAIAVDLTSATAQVDNIRITIYYTYNSCHFVAGGRVIW